MTETNVYLVRVRQANKPAPGETARESYVETHVVASTNPNTAESDVRAKVHRMGLSLIAVVSVDILGTGELMNGETGVKAISVRRFADTDEPVSMPPHGLRAEAALRDWLRTPASHVVGLRPEGRSGYALGFAEGRKSGLHEAASLIEHDADQRSAATRYTSRRGTAARIRELGR